MSIGEQQPRRPAAGPGAYGREARVRQAPAPWRLDVSSPLAAQVMVTAILTLATIQILGPVSNLLQIGFLLLLAAIHWRSVLLGTSKTWAFLAYPLLAAASAIWSTEPDISLRYGLQFLFTALGGLLIASTLSPERFLTAVYVANAIVAIGSLFSNRYGSSMEGPVMIGLTGSKNQMAFVSQLTLASAAAVLLDRNQPRLLRASTIVSGLIAFLLLIQAKSAGGIITAVGATAAFVGLLALRGFSAPVRVGAVVAAMLFVTPIVVMKDAIVEQAQYISATVFKKDPTLTGRTYLWAQADHLIEQRPIVGHGYRSIWLGDSVTTTGLLRWANLSSGRGFNFHNTFKEVTVDTGFVGLAVFITTMAALGVLLLGRFLREGAIVWAFIFSTYLSYLIRAFAEVIIGPFAVSALILFCFAGYAILRGWREKPQPVRQPATEA